MSIDIKINLDSLGINDQLSPKIVQAVQTSIQGSLAIIRDKWQSEAQKKLHSTRPLYLQGLQFDSVQYPYKNNWTGVVQLTGKLPNMIETGTPAFDIKIGLGNSPRKTNKPGGGWYITVPMRHSTPNSYLYGKPMPKDIYNMAKKLGNRQSLSIKGQGDVSWTGYQRKYNTYDGLTRIIKDYGKVKQSQYYTFRRVSDKSDPKSWWHSGFKGIKIAKNLETFSTQTFTDMIKASISSIK